MKSKLHSRLIVLALLAGVHQAAAQGTRFFRISGSGATTITAFRPDGTMVWSNAQPGASYPVQTVSSLPGGTNWVDYVQLPVTQAVNTNLLVAFNPPAGMALIPAGLFTMGNYLINGSSITNDPDITNANPTNVTVSVFYMDVNLVSYSQWQAVYNWATNHGYDFVVNAGLGKAANHPVYEVDWYDCVKWCNARSQQAGLTPVYYTDAGLTQVYTNGEVTPYVSWTASGYRLPTEAEWEKAARGGLSGQRFPWGNTISWSQANYYGDPLSLDPNGYAYDLASAFGFHPATSGMPPWTTPVGYFAPNGYGLYDMAGNVFEWCGDWYGTPYAGGNDPRGSVSGNRRVYRGGGWGELALCPRCAFRGYGDPSQTNLEVGFRCVRRL